MTKDYFRINIAVKVTDDVRSEAIKFSNEIAKKNQTYFVLDGFKYIPHITLYSPVFPSSITNQVLTTAGRIVTNFHPFTATFQNLRSHSGYIDLAIVKTYDWQILHETLISQLNPLREGLLRDKYLNPAELVQFNPQQREYINNYGYPNVLESFSPHLTITRLPNELDAEMIVESTQFQVSKFEINTVAAFTMGDHGTCSSLLQEWSMLTT